MIRVIDSKPHPSVLKQVICRHCGSALEYAPVDVRERDEHDYAGGSEHIRFIDCPSCQHQVTLSRW